jgi:outer membrane receptor protein involved in Fe transport
MRAKAAVTSLALGAGIAFSAALEAGRPITELCRLLIEQGVQLVYSDKVVEPGMTLQDSIPGTPTIGDLRRELSRYRLELHEISSGVFVIKRVASGSVRGLVVTEVTGRPVVAARVRVVGSEVETVTDRAGWFELRALPLAKLQLQIEHPERLPWSGELELSARRPDLRIEVRLSAAGWQVEEVEVSPDRYEISDSEQMSRHSFGRQDFERLPLRGGDTFSAIETLPGVAIGSEEAAPRMRGSGGRDVAVVVDGLELYAPFHLTDFRTPVGLIDPSAVGDLEVFTGAMPIQYGDRFGGLVRIESPGAVPETPNHLTLGTAFAGASFRGTVRERGAWSVDLRSWYPNAVWNGVNVGDDDVAPRMHDLFVVVQRPWRRSTWLSLHALGAYDQIEYTAAEQDESAFAMERHINLWGRSQTVATPSGDWEFVLGIGRLSRTRRGGFIDEFEREARVDDRRRVSFRSFEAKWSRPAGARQVLSAGLDARHVRAEYDYLAVETLTSGEGSRQIELAPRGTAFAFHLSDRIEAADRWVFELGLRWDKQSFANDHQLSPRFGFAWRLSERALLQAHLGRYSQSQRIHELEVEEGVSTFSPAQISDQFSVAWTIAARTNDEYRIGAYYRRFESLRPRWENLFSVVELLPEIERDRIRIEAERARAYGLELSGRWSSPSQRWSGAAHYTWSRVEDRDQEQWVVRSWDQRHALHGDLSWAPSPRYQLALAVYARSGWPVTSPSLALSLEQSALVHPTIPAELRNTERLGSYSRLDLRASWIWPRAQVRWVLDVSVLNLTDRKNPCCLGVVLDPETQELEVETEILNGRSPSITVSYRF